MRGFCARALVPPGGAWHINPYEPIPAAGYR
jgi:hypothetical protein